MEERCNCCGREFSPQEPILDNAELAVEVGANILEARVCMGFTQEKLAKEMNTHQPSIARVERGSKLPSLPFLLRVANALETSIIPPTFSCISDNGSEVTSTASIK